MKKNYENDLKTFLIQNNDHGKKFSYLKFQRLDFRQLIDAQNHSLLSLPLNIILSIVEKKSTGEDLDKLYI